MNIPKRRDCQCATAAGSAAGQSWTGAPDSAMTGFTQARVSAAIAQLFQKMVVMLRLCQSRHALGLQFLRRRRLNIVVNHSGPEAQSIPQKLKS
jgi:hypothetical protein